MRVCKRSIIKKEEELKRNRLSFIYLFVIRELSAEFCFAKLSATSMVIDAAAALLNRSRFRANA